MSEALSTRGYVADAFGTAPSAPSLSTSINTIDVIWTANVDLSVVGQLASNWIITAVVGYGVTVLTVTQIDPTTTRLTTTDQTVGGSYTLDIPAAGVTNQSDGSPNPLFSLNFTGLGHLPSFVSAVPQSTTTVLATFSEAVVVSEATNPLNYNIDHSLVVQSIDQVSSTQFLLTTNEAVPGLIYIVTSSNIHDLASNPVT